MSVKASFRRKICPVMVSVLHHNGTCLRGLGTAAILIFLLSSIAWSQTQDQRLAETFSPILILTTNPTKSDRKVIFPESVEIVGANSVSNLWFLVYRHNFFDLQYPASGWRPDLLRTYENYNPFIIWSHHRYTCGKWRFHHSRAGSR